MKHILLSAFLLLALPGFAQKIHGVKIYYSNRVVKIAASEMPQGWIKAPADDVQVVNVYYERTYHVYLDCRTESEPEKAPCYQERRYKDVLEGKDYYYWSPTAGWGTTNLVGEIPDDVPTVKIGRMLPDGEWLELYNKANNDHTF